MVHNIQISVLLTFWEQLKGIKYLSFSAKTRSKTGWDGQGQGEVIVLKKDSLVCLFNEKGTWKGRGETEFSFSNVFRWTLDQKAGVISLEHLRQGLNHPVFLFDLVPYDPSFLSSINPHLCKEDTYSGQIYLDSHGFRFHWRVIGPKKNEEINYLYSRFSERISDDK